MFECFFDKCAVLTVHSITSNLCIGNSYHPSSDWSGRCQRLAGKTQMFFLLEVKTPSRENTLLGLQNADVIPVVLCLSHAGPAILMY